MIQSWSVKGGSIEGKARPKGFKPLPWHRHLIGKLTTWPRGEPPATCNLLRQEDPMSRSVLLKPLSLCAAFMVVAAPSPASDPVGVYALIDRVVVTPDANNPSAIQIFGTFALANGSGSVYHPAQKGYLYYTVNSRNERATQAEWSDLQKIAGTKDAVGFGGRYTPLGTVRSAKQAPEKPDVYPLGFGLVKISTNNGESRVDANGRVLSGPAITHIPPIIQDLQRVAASKDASK
jgi:hypothetical protein